MDSSNKHKLSPTIPYSIVNNMIKQMRVKFSGIEQGNQGEISRDRHRKLPSQRTPSLKPDNRRGQSWYRGQSSRELTYDYDSDYMESDEFRTAVAAAAFAIGSVEERRIQSQQRDDILSKPRTKHEDGPVSVTGRARARERILSSSASNRMKNKDDIATISTPSLLSTKSSELQEKVPRERANSLANTGLKERGPRETGGSSPFFKKTSTSFDKQSDKRTPESGLASSSSSQNPTKQPTFPATGVNRKRSEHRHEDTKADVWEKTEMERIKERHEKLIAKILEWENEKKTKAKKKLSRNKDESENKRARALQNFKTNMEMIDQIAEGARTQAEENRRKEVIKVKEKTNTIRLTGKIPTKTCLCF